MTTGGESGFRRIKNRIDKSEAARQHNNIVGAIEKLSSGLAPVRWPIVARQFTHFKIEVRRESGTWKGYVGNGYLGATEEGSTAFAINPARQQDVTHEGTSIKLAIGTFPWGDGIQALVDGNDGKTLSSGTTYYVYLKYTVGHAAVFEDGEMADTNYGSNILVDTFVSCVTSFETTLKEDEVSSSGDGTTNFARYFLLGVVEIDSADNYAEVGQLSYGPVLLPPIYRGHTLDHGITTDSTTGHLRVISTDANQDLTEGSDGGTFYEEPP